MLANEAGLSYKCVSERHYYASLRKLTAGEAGKEMTKVLKQKVSAKEVKSLYAAHYGREPEWHHSGFYRNTTGRTMGRTFFLSEEEVQTLIENYQSISKRLKDAERRDEEQRKRLEETRVAGFFWIWDYDYGGNYGKKRHYKVLGVYDGNKLNRPSNFTPCDDDVLQRVKANVGKKYFGWDEPKLEEFL